jgi:hypothetical protein
MTQTNPSGISVGLPGHASVRHDTVAGPIATALAVYEANHPWIVADSTVMINELMNAGVGYPFDTLDDVFLWARIRLVTSEILRFAAAPGGNSNWRRWYRLIEAQRTEFQRVGDLDPTAGPQVFTCLGIDYTLVKAGNSHYYVSRNGKNIGYSGRLTDSKVRSIIKMLHGGTLPGGGDTGHIDEFVCAYLAEPTRWSEEQAFNLFAIKTSPADRALTGSVGTILLPMASGSTYEPATGRPGAQVPRRIIHFATQIGLVAVVGQEIQNPTTTSVATLRANVLGQYGM